MTELEPCLTREDFALRRAYIRGRLEELRAGVKRRRPAPPTPLEIDLRHGYRAALAYLDKAEAEAFGDDDPLADF